MAIALRLVAATPEMRNLLTAVLAEHGISFRIHGRLVVVEGGAECRSDGDAMRQARGQQIRVLRLLRSALSRPERDAVSVVEELAFPDEFPVTTRLEAWWSVFETSWFEEAKEGSAFSIWFQPVMNTTVRRVIGYECLIRLTSGHRREGKEIMGAAADRGELHSFDAFARKLAIGAAADARPRLATAEASGLFPGFTPGNAQYFVNFLPAEIYRPAYCFQPMLELLQERRMGYGSIVMEAVGSVHNSDPEHLKRISGYLRHQGVGFALDDVEPNAETLRMVCELLPDYVKVDARLIHRIEHTREAAALRRLVDVSEGLGVKVIAKGVERISTMERLWASGVHLMQGYLFGAPAPEASLPVPAAARRAPSITVPPELPPQPVYEELVSA
jgi:EAL domain-containing protein (putative c-di-GMP-specific phosphodiesterase class I)